MPLKGVTFAAASIAEGAVRFFGDIAMSVSDMFATESQNALKTGSTPPTERSHALDTPTKDTPHTDQLDTHSAALIMNDTTQLDESSLIHSQMSDDCQDDDQSSFIFLWAMNNVDDIMADTLGVGSLAPELLTVFVVCYFASLILLGGNRSKEQHEKSREKPSHISVPKKRLESVTHDTHNDTDSHTTITADWTTKIEKQRIRSSFLKHIARVVFFVVLSPVKLFVLAACWVWSLLFNRKSILFLLYSSKCVKAVTFDSLHIRRMIFSSCLVTLSCS